ncbi:uncharacterized protein LOC131218060 [Magnolia sinica]|uniref:uncharacterized protein LOC131218060 n=1 Tax=Magnolia sinica TaxID=86752 RepID=UPI00265B0DD7|nr:uncharacterized protein LOC131218060 [Magnolia sinica]
MEKMRKGSILIAYVVLMLLLVSSCFSCTTKDNGCKDCILKQLKCDCPNCKSVLRCMAGCLWHGSSQVKCIKKCDSCKSGPRLSKCKKCMNECKCSCVTYST